MNLKKVKIGVSPIGGTIYIYREGKTPGVAVEKREAEADVMMAVARHMMHDAPKGSSKVFGFARESFEISVTPLPEANDEPQ